MSTAGALNAWGRYAVCPCGEFYHAPFGDRFHIHDAVCTRCGTPKTVWELVTGRVKVTGVWYKPWTWFDHTFQIQEAA